MTLNWNGLDDTIECLESLKKLNYPNYEVVVVDNGSEGNDTDVLKDKFGDYIHLIRNDKNYGASGGYNTGMKYVLENSDAEYLLILDNDAVVAPEILDEMIKVFNTDKSIGVVSAMIYYYDKPDRLHIIRNEVGFWGMDYHLTIGLVIKWIKQKLGNTSVVQCDSIKQVEQFGFWCALFRREVIERTGLLAGECGGFETVDYCIRVREVGYKVVYAIKAKAWHKFRSTKRTDGIWQYYGSRGILRFMKKHATVWQYRFFLFHFFAIHVWMAIAYYLLWYHRPKMLFCFCKGVRDGLSNNK